jgi:hypothetical protein
VFGFVIGFIELLQNVAASKDYIVTVVHTSQITRTLSKVFSVSLQFTSLPSLNFISLHRTSAVLCLTPTSPANRLVLLTAVSRLTVGSRLHSYSLKFEVIFDRQSVGQSVMASSPI